MECNRGMPCQRLPRQRLHQHGEGHGGHEVEQILFAERDGGAGDQRSIEREGKAQAPGVDGKQERPGHVH